MRPKRLDEPICVRKRADYLRVQADGHAFRGRYVVLLLATGNGVDARVGFTVSRRVGGAVTRNKVRRRIREVIRTQWLDALHTGSDCVFIARPAAVKADFWMHREDIGCLLRRAGGQLGPNACW